MFSKNAITVLEKRYLKKDDSGKTIEKVEDMFKRVAHAVASGEKSFDSSADVNAIETKFLNMMLEKRFMPNSPTLMNAGRDLGQLSACFVLPVGDSISEIFESVKHAALIHQSGGGTGFSFSRLRPKNDIVKSTHGTASGPVSFMKAFNTATEVVKQGGTRRGANMGMLRVDHPDILEFVSAKSNNNELNNFNISVAITDDFMKALKEGGEYKLINPRTKKDAGYLKATDVFNMIVKLAWKNGEPGIVFIDRVNKENPTPMLGEMESTNPCGEQPLLPYEACNLGSVNLSMFVENKKFDFEKLKETVKDAIHFLDNVIEVNKYPLEKIDEMARGNRKVGLGLMGFADTLFMLEMAYDSKEAEEFATKVMKTIQDESHKASGELAKKRGNFKFYDKSVYAKDNTPMRNATTTTIAPTGTISIIADASSGIEPIFALAFKRNVMDNTELVEINPVFLDIAKREGFGSDEIMKKVAESGTVSHIDEIPEKWKKIFKVSHDISPEWHIRIQAAFQKYTDNAVSKTINFLNGATEENVREGYMLAYSLGCKGCTVYRDGSRDSQVLTVGSSSGSSHKREEEDFTNPHIAPRVRPRVTSGYTIKTMTACGTLYVTINEDDYGICEVFATIGKSGGCASSQAEGISRLVSLALRSGVEIDAIVKQLRGIRCTSPIFDNGELILSCPDAIARALDTVLQLRSEDQADNGGVSKINDKVSKSKKHVSHHGGESCPECGSTLNMAEGCMSCSSCGYSKCS